MPSTIATRKPRTTKTAEATDAKPKATTTRKPRATGADSKTAKTAAAPKAKETKPKFVAPDKPSTDPGTLKIEDYGYELPNGKFKFWQGWDAKFKKHLMGVSRDPGSTAADRKAARAILVERGWSTEDREAAQAQVLADRAKPKVKKETPKAEPKKRSTAKKETKPEPVAETPAEVEAPVVEDAPAEPVAA